VLGVATDEIFIIKAGISNEKEAWTNLYAGYCSEKLTEKSESENCAFIAPRVRLLYTKTQEAIWLLNELMTLSENKTELSGRDSARIHRLTQRKSIILTEFFRGKSLPSITYNVANEYFPLTPSSQGNQDPRVFCLQKLSAIILFDIIVNNWDRFPIQGIWNQTGNPKNVMLHKNLDHNSKNSDSSVKIFVYVIDQTCSAINFKTGKDKYVENVKLFVKEVFIDNKKEAKSVISVKAFLQGAIETDLGKEAIEYLRNGLKITYETLFKEKVLEDGIKECEEKLLNMVENNMKSIVASENKEEEEAKKLITTERERVRKLLLLETNFIKEIIAAFKQ